MNSAKIIKIDQIGSKYIKYSKPKITDNDAELIYPKYKSKKIIFNLPKSQSTFGASVFRDENDNGDTIRIYNMNITIDNDTKQMLKSLDNIFVEYFKTKTVKKITHKPIIKNEDNDEYQEYINCKIQINKTTLKPDIKLIDEEDMNVYIDYDNICDVLYRGVLIEPTIQILYLWQHKNITGVSMKLLGGKLYKNPFEKMLETCQL